MQMICNVMKVMDKAKGTLTQTCTKLLERNTKYAPKYRAKWNDIARYEVYGPWHDQHVVDMRERWQVHADDRN